MPRWLTLTSLATLLAFLVMVLPAGHAHAQQPPQPPPPPPAQGAPAAPPPGGQVDPELAQAQAHFQAGKDAFAAGDSTTAIREWKAAQALRPSPKLDYNIGLAYEKLNRPRAATKYYRRYIEQLPTAPNRAEVEQKIQQLASRAAKAPADEGTEGATPPPPPGAQQGAVQQPGAQPQYQQVPPGYQPPPGYPAQPGQPGGYQAQPGYPQQPPAYGQPGQPPTYYANQPAPVQPVQPPPAKKSSNWWIVFPIVGGVLLTLMFIYLLSGAGSGRGGSDWDAVPGGGRGDVPPQDPALFRF